MAGEPRPVVKVYTVLLDPGRRRHLVWRGEDETTPEGAFHRPLGGHLELGEHSREGAVREIEEELGEKLEDVELLGVLETVFTFRRALGHEVVFVYAATLPDAGVPDAGAWRSDGGAPIWVEWRDVAGAPLPLHPEGLQELVDRWLARPGPHSHS
ncbi:NUDIX domain-containing protein [Auraticoccus monumenti]|uniref:ADP-ribose pyrophosphatase YjhB, NUDIX family n=1 Tax=Auraticoccus monumenti TaxID=675864 RepID=A0A1G7DCV1_9ACTN|nr:NUDIX domain-containing protein [Auraticoccus monumenti]SDE48800.1 ADP-ribose pyrophosphatase YjhB, NUDIX family [Auraticoccus monumenti]